MATKTSLLCLAAGGCLMLGGWHASADEAAPAGNASPSDETARLQAIDKLGARGAKDAEAVAPLTEMLKDASPTVRAHAAGALGRIGAPAKPAVPALAMLLKDSDETVRRQAVRAIMSIHPGPKVTVPLAVKLLEEDADPGVRMRVLHAISEVGAKAVPGLIEALKNEKAAYWACLVLREIGPAGKDAVPALIEKLQDPRPEIRREVILTLAAMGDAAIPAAGQIAAALNDQHTSTAATYALGRIGRIPASAEAAIRANAKSDDAMLRTTSLWALASVHPEDKQLRREATEQLIARLKDQDSFVRVAAARALAALPPAPEITVPIWEKALQDSDETTVGYALDVLAELGSPAVPRLIDALRHEKLRSQVVYVLGQIGPDAAPATPALAVLLADKNERVAQDAAIALAKIGPGAKGAVPSLVKALGQADASNAPTIAYALGKIGPAAAEAEPALSDLLKSPHRNVALASAWAMVQIRPGSAEVAAQTLPALTAGLASDLAVAREGAAEALGQLGPLAKEAVAALEQTANDKNENVRLAAAKALGSIRGK